MTRESAYSNLTRAEGTLSGLVETRTKTAAYLTDLDKRIQEAEIAARMARVDYEDANSVVDDA